ncbi:uncharacterized protein LOC124336192 [Daphnia pulicaria]|uniref:uncharacterized protein LOC124336192 n=1 Tax=Daphnia pulicaria TaxID=35523 RepID=UPI001EEA148B|nr:uncharacterized protein LOC124336192 [Daphnia pulicaria]
MVHFCAASFIQVGILLILTCLATGSTVTNIVALKELRELKLEFKELGKKLETKVYQLEEKNLGLEEKVTQLEAKNVQLETKVQNQEILLASLLLQFSNQADTPIDSKAISNYQTETKSSSRAGITRTCQELRADNPSLPSGMQWIDPDGQGVGDNPIYVYCDMTTGSTSILHDSESAINVGHCADPGCYSRYINYNASMGQIKSLAELSAECHQSIQYDCYYAPFELNGYAYSWWNDRDGKSQYFWSGNNAAGIHTCQCGIDGNCVDSIAKCNCDSVAPVQLVDNGVITDKNVLPVTRLNFGRTQLETSSGIHTLGRLVCTGSVALTRMPTSCKDLWLIGHTLNGFYSIMGSTTMESVYCDFTKVPGDDGFEKWIGYADVKSAPAHFYVQRSSSFNTELVPIPFDVARINVGNAFNLTTGKFTAPRSGVYSFAFTGSVELPATTSLVRLQIILYLNGNGVGIAYLEEGNTVAFQNDQLSLQSTLKLKSGDQVWVQIQQILPGVYLADNGDHYTHFTGFMLEEDIASSL